MEKSAGLIAPCIKNELPPCNCRKRTRHRSLRPLLTVLSFSFFLLFLNGAEGVELDNITVILTQESVTVGAELNLDDAQISDLKNGIHKELIFYIDLFKEWNVWPDEFISGVKIIRKVKCDPVKKEFSMISYNESSITELRFNSLESLLDAALKIDNLTAFRTEGLRPGRYFVKVSAESRIRKLAPLIGYLLFFVPENEFGVEMNSQKFTVPVQ